MYFVEWTYGRIWSFRCLWIVVLQELQIFTNTVVLYFDFLSIIFYDPFPFVSDWKTRV